MAEQMEQDWHHSGVDCCEPLTTGEFKSFNQIQNISFSNRIMTSLGLLSFFLPCIAYGRTQHRLHKDSQLKNWSMFNGDCCLYWATTCFTMQWIPLMLQRGDIREKYGLKGNSCTDCLCAGFCTPCALTQCDKEVEYRKGENARVIDVQPEKMGDGQAMQYPEQQDPGQQDPEQQDPEQQVPEQQVPEQQDPEQQVPEQQVPEQQVPEQQDPEQQ
ncbi:hypothetical protein EJ08DRAFT_729960 [Tothia fuscella]|uniref:PLAC8 family protein n=1 Tax=Tothia fuscella TaxID=1048955 RepID=A0A9P4U318_9PEZI|nr:hypothetical protein EJ08DRAFT_729960 [Tothia fuscella]